MYAHATVTAGGTMGSSTLPWRSGTPHPARQGGDALPVARSTKVPE